ncbi:putative MoxY [Xylogone sp. PMI_703]|nr:putative MoxY [Xylogone sp. PMI_703]
MPDLTSNGHANGYTNGQTKNGAHIFSTTVKKASDVIIKESPMGTKRPLKVIFIGMGASGINFAYQLPRLTENIDLVVYEKNDDIGGTWLENRYPGWACDIPSVGYQYSWQRKTNWSHYYSGSKEIHSYLRDVAESNNLLKYVKFRHEIVRAEFLDDIGKWKVTVMRDGNPFHTFDDYADFLLNGSGVLNNWKWPDIKGLHSFSGPLVHTARWDETLDLQDKRVLIIGGGSSSTQVVPTIIDKVKDLSIVIRSPIWVTAGFAPTYAGPNGENFAYSEETKKKFADEPDFYLSYCKAIESELNIRFKFILNGTKDAIEAKEYSAKEMARKLAGRPDLIDKIVPTDFGVGCRRPTPGNGFLEALTLNRTTVYTEMLQEITPTGFVDDQGVHHEVDVVICATGFDTTFRPRFPIIANGFNLQDEYSSKDITGYMGLSSPEIPNYFIFIGPYGPLGHGSVIPMVEAYTTYVIQVLQKVQIEDIKKIQPNRAVSEDFTRYADAYLKRTAWSGPCDSWFKAGDRSRKPVCWPGSRVHYMMMLQTPRFEDFDIEYISKSRFSFLGNGFDVREFDGRDLTWYYGLLDGADKQPKSFPPPLY